MSINKVDWSFTPFASLQTSPNGIPVAKSSFTAECTVNHRNHSAEGLLEGLKGKAAFGSVYSIIYYRTGLRPLRP